jgi:hypothetical protein
VEHRHLRQRLAPAGDHGVEVAEDDLVGRVGDGLVGEAQARLTVKLCTPLGSCGMSEISRAMFGSAMLCTTVPYTTAWTSLGSISLRARSSATQPRPSSVAERRARALLALANGVRTPATTATRRPGWP